MNEFSFTNLKTFYRSSGFVEKNILENGDYCFRGIFKDGQVTRLRDEKVSGVYEVYFFRTPNRLVGNKWNNYCPFSLDIVKRHLMLGKQYFTKNFKYKVEEVDFKNSLAYKVTIDINESFIYHKVVLTWLRYLYEYPTNMLLMDAYRLKDVFPRVSIFNLYNFISGCYDYSDYKSDQTLTWGSPFRTVEEIHKVLKKRSAQSGDTEVIRKTFLRMNDNKKVVNRIRGIFKDSERANLSYWTDNFSERCEKYVEEFKEHVKCKKLKLTW